MTADTLSSILDSVQSLDDVGAWLQIPLSKREELQRQYDRRQLPRAYSTIFLTEVPSPSWSTVALALWENRELGALEIVQKLYLKYSWTVFMLLYFCFMLVHTLDTTIKIIDKFWCIAVGTRLGPLLVVIQLQGMENV